MARRGIPKQINWHLREWMDYLKVNQAEMVRRTDWSKATASQLYNNVQDYSPKLVNEAAKALGVETWELLMPPETAAAIRRARAEQLRLVPPPNGAAPAKPHNVRKRAVRT